jgi:hypothetical protein
MRYLLPAFAITAAVAAQTNYLQNAEAGMQALQQWYKESNGVWDTIGWWNSANAMTTVAELGTIDPNFKQNASDVFYHCWVSAAGHKSKMIKRVTDEGRVETTYGPPERAHDMIDAWNSMLSRRSRIDWKGFTDDFYDDNGWWALAWIAAYDVTKDPDYLALAQAIYDNNLSKGGPTKCKSGGIVWSKTQSYVNAIANELYFSVAAHLAARSTSDKAPGYLQNAKDQLNWFLNSGMINAQNTINDGLDDNCNNNNGPIFSYNQV